MPSNAPTFATIATPNPAAGAEISFTASQNEILIVSLVLTLATDATVANRSVRINAADANGAVYFRSYTNFAQAASTTTSYCFAAGVQISTASSSCQTAPLPSCGLWIPKNGTLTTTTLNMASGDDLTVATLLLQTN